MPHLREVKVGIAPKRDRSCSTHQLTSALQIDLCLTRCFCESSKLACCVILVLVEISIDRFEVR